MPPAAKQKRAAADRAKGASRAKSGCYTCRIRRKKCDEELDTDGACKTCSRLRLQCLGFGTKRPDYLRDNDKVNEMRDKIKLHLATNGMIKGHAGASSRAMDDRPVCMLHESPNSEFTPSPESSPQSPAYSLNDDDGFSGGEYTLGLHRHALSSVRDDKYPMPNLTQRQSSTSAPPTSSFDDPPTNSSALMAPSPAPVELPQPFGPDALPQYVSTFGQLYNINFSTWGEDSYLADPTAFGELGLSYMPQMTIPTPFGLGNDEFIYKYCSRLAKAQFLLADESKFADILFGPMQGSELLKKAARLLSMVDDSRTRDPTRRALSLTDVKLHHDALWREASGDNGVEPMLWNRKAPEEIATAAMITVSAYLFDGGRGRWKPWLGVLCKWAHDALYSDMQTPPALALIKSTERGRFLIKTAMWFDVLASVTTQKSPIFFDTFRELFGPTESGISELDMAEPHTDSRLSMLEIMGCENSVVWALSETTCLAEWKTKAERAGQLSNKDLVTRATAIETVLAQPRPAPPFGLTFDPAAHDRQLTADIFHAAARLYLHTVVSGAHPRVPDIQHAVRATLDALRRVHDVASGPNIVRNTVFAAFIAGALADGDAARAEVRAVLELGVGGTGNCRPILDLLQRIWTETAAASPSNPVPWRDRLFEERMLLV
ncbi:fungal-specific transcription factor domain-containing protein [Schizophyllum commune]